MAAVWISWHLFLINSGCPINAAASRLLLVEAEGLQSGRLTSGLFINAAGPYGKKGAPLAVAPFLGGHGKVGCSFHLLSWSMNSYISSVDPCPPHQCCRGAMGRKGAPLTAYILFLGGHIAGSSALYHYFTKMSVHWAALRVSVLKACERASA
eukprot:1004324-Pelagomonas_calceolata.AAC.3